MTLPAPVPEVAGTGASSTGPGFCLSVTGAQPAGTGPGETGTGDFPPTTLRTCSRTYRGSSSLALSEKCELQT